MEQTAIYPIGYVQKETGLSARQIRYYEQMGLLTPARTEGKQRRYSQRDIETLKKIKSLLAAGLGLDAIKLHLDKHPGPAEALRPAAGTLPDQELLTVELQKRRVTSLFPVKNRGALQEILAESTPKDES